MTTTKTAKPATSAKSNIGVIGLGVMGSKLSLNLLRNGLSVSVFNRSYDVTQKFLQENPDLNLKGSSTMSEFVLSLELPRKIILIISAGTAVDSVLDELALLMDPKDIVMDFGNSYYKDSIRRGETLKSRGFEFADCGISGGEIGALTGASIMVGATDYTWKHIAPLISGASAKDFNHGMCISHLGPVGSGHFVKMCHNGIEYGIMGVLSEGYALLKNLTNLSNADISQVFSKYKDGPLGGYLVEASVDVIARKDDLTEGDLIDHISDSAGQKGTGKWFIEDALSSAVNVNVINAAVDTRNLSSQRATRKKLAPFFAKPKLAKVSDIEGFTLDLEKAMLAGFLVSYSQGLQLISEASTKNNWNVNLQEVVRIWEGGCIIRGRLLVQLRNAVKLSNLVVETPAIAKELNTCLPSVRKILLLSVESGLTSPCIYGALSYLEQISSGRLPTVLVQGLRDYFGSHTYKRTDKEGDFHTLWH